jgi:uncharacterized protein YbaP (TraB family)
VFKLSHYYRSGFLLIIFITITFSCYAQNAPYTLLWRISGKGLSNPSYLFGTMHIKDKRVFNFSDSVMLAINKCDNFALEVNPDSIVEKMFAIMQRNDTVSDVHKLLTPEQYKSLAKKFKKKTGFELGKTNAYSIESLMNKNEKPDDKVTFIDAYLYGIARTLNKKVAGLERSETQIDEYYHDGDHLKQNLLGLLDDDNSQYAGKVTDQMARVYSTGNLDKIYQMVTEMHLIDSVLIGRNNVMVNSMLKIMKTQSLFTAVGVAHLPGPYGIIEQLKHLGYTVVPVKATFTGVKDRYHIDYVQMDWPVHHDVDNGYSIEFPGKPILTSLNGINTTLYANLTNEMYLGLYVMPRGTSARPANRAKVIKEITKNFSGITKNQLLSQKQIMFNSLPCTELYVKNASGYMRMRLLLVNNMLYCLYVGGKQYQLEGPYANRFLNSFKNYDLPFKPDRPWVTYTDTAGAFSSKFPVMPRVIVQEPDVPGRPGQKVKLNLYVGTDTANSKSYLIRYNDYPAGTYLKDKQEVLNSLVKEFGNKGKVVAKPVKIWKDGVEGREMKVFLSDKYYTTIRLYARGNRLYLLLKEVLEPNIKDDSNDGFFDSFNLKAFKEPILTTYAPINESFSLKVVSEPKLVRDSDTHHGSYITKTDTYYNSDPNSGNLYMLQHSQISPYYRTKHIDTLFSELTNNLKTYADTILKIDTINVNGIAGREVIKQTKVTGQKNRIRVLINNQDIFYLVSYTDSSNTFSQVNNTFYNSLQIIHSQNLPPVDLYSSKASKLINDLKSTDSLARKEALNALSFYKFETNELPYIYKALQSDYHDDTLTTGVRYKLISTFKSTHDDSTATKLISLYKNLDKKEELKALILSSLPVIDKANGYQHYIEMLKASSPLHTSRIYQLFNPLYDSVAIAANNLNQLLPLMTDNQYRTQILRLAVRLADNKTPDYTSVIKKEYYGLTAYALSDLHNYIKYKDSTDNAYAGKMYQYLQLMANIKNQAVNDKFTRTYLRADPKGTYVTEAVQARIHNRLTNNPVIVTRLLDTLSTRYDIMQAFNAEGQIAKVPAKYRVQAEFAKLCLYQYAGADEDYNSLQNIRLLGTINKSGWVYYAFKFTQPDREANTTFIGIAGPYKRGNTMLNFKKYNAYSEYTALKHDWHEQAYKLIEPLNDQYK